MSYGLYDYNRRYRRRFWTRLGKLLLALLLIGGVAGFSYMVGVEQTRQRTDMLEADLAAMTAARDQAEDRAQQMQQIAREAEVRANELQVRYQRDVPTGELAGLKDLVARKLAEGVDAGRLTFVLEQTGNARDCTDPEAKRFVLPTALYRGANRSVSFANGAVTITGEGESAKDASGNPEAWFDPTQPVTLRFIQMSGATTEAKGLLPLQHSVVIEDTEHRFTIAPGARSFVEISGDSCPFP